MPRHDSMHAPRWVTSSVQWVPACSAPTGTTGTRPSTRPALGREAAMRAPLPGQDFNPFSQETRVLASRRVGAGSGVGIGRRHKASACGVARGKGHQSPSSRLLVALHMGFLAPALGHPRAERTFRAQRQAGKVPMASNPSVSPQRSSAHPDHTPPTPRTTRSFSASSHRSSA